MGKNNGKPYEAFVAGLQEALLRSEDFTKLKNISIERNKVITDNTGVAREFDLYWEYELGGITYKTVIECKDYNSRIPLEKIDALIGKIRDIPDLKPVFATKTGYQSGAITKAEHNKIELLIVREQNSSDWEDKLGNPLIKTINISFHLQSPAVITEFHPILDGHWVEKNGLDPKEIDLNIMLPTNEIFIDDMEVGSVSLFEIESKFSTEVSGSFEIEKKFNNAFISYGKKRLKLHSYKLIYVVPEPIIQDIKIDYGNQLIGVIEYLNKGHKLTFFKDRIDKEDI